MLKQKEIKQIICIVSWIDVGYFEIIFFFNNFEILNFSLYPIFMISGKTNKLDLKLR
jgi:hypothetical protein